MAGDTHKLLNDLAADNEVERIERGLEKFNLFSALGVERLEVQHSNFLAYLLNPRQKHGLEDRFLKKFLQSAIRDPFDRNLQISLIDIDTWELRHADVQRERRNTDIFVTDGKHFSMVIENKVDSNEHDHQLTRYRTELANEFPTHKRILLYLTPAGALPEQDEETGHWIPVDYGCIEKVLTKEIIDVSADLHLNEEVDFALRQYVEILRRFIVADSDDAKRCRAFYRKHRAALDLIRDQVDRQRARLKAEARRLLAVEVENDDHLELDESAPWEIRFALRSIDKKLPKGGTLTKTGRILFFSLWIEQVGITFAVGVGPGNNEARKELFRIAGMEPMKPQINLDGFLKTQWNTVYKRQLIGPEGYSLERDEFVKNLMDEWNAIKADDLPKIENAIDQGLNGPPLSTQSGTATLE